MKALAKFVMRGYSQAALVASVSALLSLLVPLFGLISSATVGLVTLRNGLRSGLMLALLSTLGAGLFSALALGAPWLALGILVVFWMPVILLGGVLRATRSLNLMVQLAGLGGLALVVVFYLLIADPSMYWQQLLEPLRQSLVTDGVLTAEVSQGLFAKLATWMTGAFAAALVFQLLVALFIARWWQAELYNPGGFGEEFRALRLSRVAGFSVLVLTPLPFIVHHGVAGDLLPVLGGLLVFQGLAVAHQIRWLLGARQAWLVGLYALLVLFMPQAGLLIACIGLVDIWLDFRARVAQRVARPR